MKYRYSELMYYFFEVFEIFWEDFFCGAPPLHMTHNFWVI